MSSNRIEQVEISAVRTGQYITGVDYEGLTDAEINEDYSADHMYWGLVTYALHYADVSRVTTEFEPGEPGESFGAGYVWRLVGADGRPVTKED